MPSTSERLPIFAPPSGASYPAHRGRALMFACAIHSAVLIALVWTVTRYQARIVPSMNAMGVTFIMAPERGIGSPSPSTAAPSEPPRPAADTPRVADQGAPPVLPSAAPLATEALAAMPAMALPALPAAAAATADVAATFAPVPSPEVPVGTKGKSDDAGGNQAPALGALSGQSNWAGLVLGRLEQFRRYPLTSRRGRQEGVAFVRFTIDRGGRVLASALDRTSGHVALDREAVALVQRAAPLPAPPRELEGETVTLTVPVEFFLTR